MPAELFHPSISRVGGRRHVSLLPVSVAAHAVILAAWFIVPLFADGELPEPPNHARATYVEVRLPPPPSAEAPPRRVPPQTPGPTSNPKAAPLVAPDRIVPEHEVPPPESGVPIGRGTGEGIPGSFLSVEGALAPPPVSVPKVPVRPGGIIERPRKLKDVTPIYPQIALTSRVEGTVIIEAIIGEDGRVKQARVLRPAPLLEEAALSAVRQWVFTPTRLNGEAVPVVMTVTVDFRLR